MKNLFCALFMGASILTCQAQNSVDKLVKSPDDSVKILWIGNSYTYFNDVPAMVQNIGALNGVSVSPTRILKGGERLKGHLQNPQLHEQIKKGGWDFVVIQENSSLPAYSTKFVAEEVKPYAAEIDSLVKAYTPEATTVYYMTWGHRNGNIRQTDYPLDDNYEDMQARLVTSYTEMAFENNGLLAPVGRAWREIRRNHPEIDLYTEDNFHPSLAGSYLVANTIFATILGKDFKPLTVEGLTAEEMDILHREAVKAAVK